MKLTPAQRNHDHEEFVSPRNGEQARCSVCGARAVDVVQSLHDRIRDRDAAINHAVNAFTALAKRLEKHDPWESVEHANRQVQSAAKDLRRFAIDRSMARDA